MSLVLALIVSGAIVAVLSWAWVWGGQSSERQRELLQIEQRLADRRVVERPRRTRRSKKTPEVQSKVE